MCICNLQNALVSHLNPIPGFRDCFSSVSSISSFSTLENTFFWVQRNVLKTRSRRCMLYRHNAATGTD